MELPLRDWVLARGPRGDCSRTPGASSAFPSERAALSATSWSRVKKESSIGRLCCLQKSRKIHTLVLRRHLRVSRPAGPRQEMRPSGYSLVSSTRWQYVRTYLRGRDGRRSLYQDASALQRASRAGLVIPLYDLEGTRATQKQTHGRHSDKVYLTVVTFSKRRTCHKDLGHSR